MQEGMQQQHISEIEPRTARHILAATLRDDPYHEQIVAAAGELVAAGLGEYQYMGDYIFGKTIWRSPSKYWVDVDRYGRIDG